jgi:putative tryptophan/tyrosine transport system substrate-binding protein
MRSGQLQRREFITLVGGAAAWPLTAHAQQPEKLPTIGFMGGATALAGSQWAAAFVQRLRELGWIENRNVAIEYRWGMDARSVASRKKADRRPDEKVQ